MTPSLESVFTAHASRAEGLTHAEVQERQAEFGANALPQKKKSLLKMFLRQFQDVLIYILIGALLLSLTLSFLQEGEAAAESFTDSMAIAIILLLNAVLGFIQEFRSEKEIEALQRLTETRCNVRREGKEVSIPSHELVPGDVVLLETGDKICADGLLVVESHLGVNESSLTGESSVVLKSTTITAQQRVFSGTLVTQGSGEFVVTAIGLQTEIGKIAKLVSETEFPETPLQARMSALGKMLGAVVLGLCAIVVGIGILQGRSMFELLLLGTSLAVSAVPEGLPAVVTVCLAIGVRRMVKQHALVRKLESLETIGSVTVICADKTGTMTENNMTVVETWTEGGGATADERLLVTALASCNRARLPQYGDPTEIGLLRYAESLEIEREPIDEEEVPFSSEEKYMKTRHGSVSYLKGAPERIVQLCSNVDAEAVLEKNEEYALRGLRILGAAKEENGEVKFVGLVAMQDPPRADVRESVLQAKDAGIRTIMITGDNIVTAKAIAEKVGIEGDSMLGEEIEKLSITAVRSCVQTVSVFARVSPEHKLLILDALKHENQIVAMSGDGVNDAPALKGAHVGIAMGKNGTDVAREAGSIVLADDNYATIVRAVGEGRRIYDNIRKFVLFLLRANFYQLLFITLTLLLGMPLPYLPIHILWINLMTDSFPALALGLEKAEPDHMKRPPRSPQESILSGEWGSLFVAAALGFSGSFLLYLWQLSNGNTLEHARTVVFSFAIVFELFLAHTMRSRHPLWRVGFTSNPWMLGATILPFMLLLLLMTTPLGAFLHVSMISIPDWGVIILSAVSGLVLFEGLKYVQDKKWTF